MNRLILIAAGLLALGSVPALAQDASPTPPPKVNTDTSVSVGGHVFEMPAHCALAAIVTSRTEDLDTQQVTLRPFFHTLVGWEPGTEYPTNVADPDNVLFNAHRGDALCLGAAK